MDRHIQVRAKVTTLNGDPATAIHFSDLTEHYAPLNAQDKVNHSERLEQGIITSEKILTREVSPLVEDIRGSLLYVLQSNLIDEIKSFAQ